MEYSLIKTEDGYILVSDEEIGFLDFFYHHNIIEQMPPLPVFKEKEYRKYFLRGNNARKIIASIHEVESLPTIAFAEEVSSHIGYIELKKISFEFADRATTDPLDKSDLALGYAGGYTRCANDNKKKLYTEEDLIKCMGFGMMQKKFPDSHEIKEFIKSLHTTKWNVEIELESNDCVHAECAQVKCNCGLEEKISKIVDNTITVLKIIEETS